MSDELPPGWVWTTIEEVCDTVSKRGPDSAKPSFQYIDLSAIDNKAKLISAASEVESKAAPSRAKQVVRKGDVVFSNVRVYLENIALVPDELDGEVASTAFCVLRPKQEIESRYLYYYVSGKRFVQTINELQRGNSPPSVQDGDVKEQSIPLAPAPEQKRIVSKIDELFSRIDEGERALERMQKLVERYRQSVLKAAVTGELTREWREKQAKSGASIETGEALLARILTTRRAAWEKAELGKMKAKGIKPKDDKWKQKYKEPSPPDTSELPELSEGWVWASLEQLAAPERNAITDGPFGSNLKTEHYTDDGPRVVRLQNIKDGVFADVKAHISAERFDQLSKHRVLAGDLLIAALGESLPRTCIAPDSLGPAIVKADCIRLKPSSHISASCLMAFLNSPPSRMRTKTIIHGVGRPRLNLDEIRSLIVPVPSRAEQEAIVDALDGQIASVEHLRSDAIRVLAQLRALRQSILAQAFAGNLVPQHSTDEPASALLERISADRTAKSAKPKRKPKIKKNASK